MRENNRDDVRNTLFQIIESVLKIDAASIKEDMELAADLRIDSLALYEIVVDIEERYSLRISNDEADDLKTVGEAVDFIVKKIAQP